MTEFDRKEYQTVILAALLHDIGKFLQRIKGIKEKYLDIKHPDLGADFVSWTGVFAKENSAFQSWRKFSQTISKDWVDKDKLDKSIRKHHSGFQQWGWIVHKSDSYSTKERFQEGEDVTTYPPKGRLVPLQPVFTSVNLGENKIKELFGYSPTVLDTFKSFPVPDKKKLDDDESNTVFMQFIEELTGIDIGNSTFEKYYNTLHSIFEKYLWCLPCHTYQKIADVSIFDHLKSASAIAACLYKYHYAENLWGIAKDIDNDEPEKFLLVGGDLSGIQKYLYQISAITGEGGVAKRLRARSFYISALVEVIIAKILKELYLPISCQFLSTGGKFMLLVPNTNDTKDMLRKLNQEISEWLLNEFSGELSLTMDWSIPLKGNDFLRKTDFKPVQNEETENEEDLLEEKNPEQYRECNFRDRLDELWLAIEKKKTEKFLTVLSENGKWNKAPFVRTEHYNSYAEGAKDCRSCEKFPAEYTDPHDDHQSEKALCKKCRIDKIIGRKLLDAEYLAIGCNSGNRTVQNNNNDQDTFAFFDGQYFIKILNSYSNAEWENDYIVVQKLRDHKDEKDPVAAGCTHRFIANYTPFFENYSSNNELCQKCKEPEDCEQKEWMKNQKQEKKHLYTFSCIAAAGSSKIADDDKDDAQQGYKGIQRIGVLKADVDNLGLIFSEGLQNGITPSRFLTMSRMFDLFFSGWMCRILKETPKYKEIYTVYSGGDDLVVVGPWEKVIRFARQLNHEFRRFTCHNNDITLSAGIAIVHPKYPISAAVSLADQYLEASKAAGKNRVTVFDTTVQWEKLPALFETKDFLNNYHKNYENILTTRFLHRLLTYHKMYKDSSRNIRNLLFHSQMHYDVRRNITERIESLRKNLKDKPEMLKELDRFATEIKVFLLKLYKAPPEREDMENLNIPVSWVLYKNRKYKIKGALNE